MFRGPSWPTTCMSPIYEIMRVPWTIFRAPNNSVALPARQLRFISLNGALSQLLSISLLPLYSGGWWPRRMDGLRSSRGVFMHPNQGNLANIVASSVPRISELGSRCCHETLARRAPGIREQMMFSHTRGWSCGPYMSALACKWSAAVERAPHVIARNEKGKREESYAGCSALMGLLVAGELGRPASGPGWG